MKFAIIFALAGCSAHKLRYNESEGPTKADNGELDQTVLESSHLGNQKGFAEWKNPLAASDDGELDDKVVLQTDGTVMVLKGDLGRARKIYDADGDGVEDNIERTRDELDRFYHPAVYGVVEDLYNTHHGNLPGHVRKEEEEMQPNYWDPYGYAHVGFADMKLHF